MVESVHGKAFFVVRLVGSKVLVLAPPIAEGGAVCLPCCYGWATTIRRDQGSTLAHGAVYFKQRWHAAARGYGYIAMSRFRTRLGVHLYGKMRRTDFFPVKEETEGEVLVRSALSESEASGRGNVGAA